MSSVGLLLLRLGIAAVSVAHGAHMMFGMFGGPESGAGPGGLSQTADRFTTIGLPGFSLAVVVAVTQLAGGLLIGVGYLTRVAGAALAAVTAMVAWKFQWPYGFFMNWVGEPTRGQGIEFSILLFVGFVCLALTGPGDWSFDGQRARQQKYAAAGRARLRGRS